MIKGKERKSCLFVQKITNYRVQEIYIVNHRQKYTKASLAAELRIKLKNYRSEIPHPSTFHSEKKAKY